MSGVKTQLAVRGYALGICIDIEGAFDSISISSVKDAMIRYKIPDTFVDWTQNMLEDRKLTTSHGNITIEGRSVLGCPQGGVLFPLL